MENASKALIIAGSILVSIVIITLGVMIVTNVTDTIQKNSSLSEQEISTYNQPFEAYLGTKSGTQARALCDKIRNHNNANTDDETRQIIATIPLNNNNAAKNDFQKAFLSNFTNRSSPILLDASIN